MLKENLLGVLGNCGGIVGEIGVLLNGLEGEGEDGKMNVGKKLKWATSGKTEMAKLRLGLEAHKSALDIALDLIAISITADIKQDTTDLKEESEKIKENTDQILHEIGNLQVQVAQMDVSQDRGYMMKRFLESSVTYAESVVNPEEYEEERRGTPEPFERVSPTTEDNPIERASTNDTISHTDRNTTSSSRTPNNYWSSLPQNERDSLFIQSAKHGNLKRMALLLASGANIDARSKQGRTSVYVSILQGEHNHRSCLQFLLENGASIDDIDQVDGVYKGNAFELAYDLKNVAAMEIIKSSHPENMHFKDLLSSYDRFSEAGAVTKKKEEAPSKIEPPSLASSKYAIALFDFEPNAENEIASEEGAAISDVVSYVGGWALGWSKGHYGLFPSNHIKFIGSAAHTNLLLAEARSHLPIWREWKTRDGNFNVEAQGLGITDQDSNGKGRKVYLQKTNKIMILVPISKLSYADLQYLERMTKVSLADDIAEAKAATETLFKNLDINLPMGTPTPDATFSKEIHVTAKKTPLRSLFHHAETARKENPIEPSMFPETEPPAIDFNKHRAKIQKAYDKSIEESNKQRSIQERAADNPLPKQGVTQVQRFEGYPTLPSERNLQLKDYQPQVQCTDAKANTPPLNEYAKLGLEISRISEAFYKSKRQFNDKTR